MNFKDLFNKAVNEANTFLEKPETKEFISKVKQGASEFKQKAEVFVEESDEKLKKIIEEKFLNKSGEPQKKDENHEVQSEHEQENKQTDHIESATQSHTPDVTPVADTVEKTQNNPMDIHISQMGFKESIEKTLAEAGFDTKNKLQSATDEQLTALVGIGKATLRSIREKSSQ